jgi:hypothetical protein
MEPSTAEIWLDRIERWRASGERAELFSRREGYAASTLRWWASKLRHELAAPVPSSPSVQLARVIRTPSVPTTPLDAPSAIALEVLDGRVRIAVEPGADPRTLAMVLEVVAARGGRR